MDARDANPAPKCAFFKNTDNPFRNCEKERKRLLEYMTPKISLFGKPVKFMKKMRFNAKPERDQSE